MQDDWLLNGPASVPENSLLGRTVRSRTLEAEKTNESPFLPPDARVALLNFFLMTSDTCLDLTMLTATDTSSLRWLSPIHLWYPTDLTHLSIHTILHRVPCGISMAGALILQLRDTMSLRKANLGLVCVSEHENQLVCLRPPQQNHPLSPLHEPLHWRAKRYPKA